jgi:signal transduction histidine kinase
MARLLRRGPERQQELFRPVHPGQPGGAGLGLSIAFRAAVAQGGALELESEPGRGSTFLLRLPWAVRAREELTDKARRHVPGG